ncbi:MAG: hypothetical protein RL173_3059, partial [Fibrobacterota bacterium]
MGVAEPIVKRQSARSLISLAFLGVFLTALPAKADKTLMFMVDFFLQQQTDTIIGLDVFQPANEIVYKGGRPPSLVLTNAYETEKFGWWYALPDFDANDYAMGRIRVNTLYKRGWYQNDSNYRASMGDTIFFPDTQTTFAYQNMKTGQNAVVTLGTAKPKFFVFPDTATYRGPKLYTSQGNSGTEILNMRPTTAGSNGMGNIDKCVDSIPGDTVWIRWGTPAAPPGQQPSAASMKCSSYNPFSVRHALVYLRNPWPGADQPMVEYNGQNVPLYPSSNSDWLVADLRYLPTQGAPSGLIRFKKSATSSNYFDSAGVDQSISMPFNVPSGGGSYYFVPPEAGGPLVKQATIQPKPKYLIYVQNPWKPGTPRLLWEADQNAHVMRPTQSCGWYVYPVYSTPTRVLIGHSFEDSSYGVAGVQFRQRANWVDIPASAINSKGEVYIQTMAAGGGRIPAATTTTPSLKDCSTDTLKLVMEVFDFKGRGEVGGNPSFQVGGTADNLGTASSGLVKGMVQSSLSTAGLPVYTGRDSGYQIGGINTIGKGIAGGPYGKSTPSNWFDTTTLKAAVPGIQIGHSCLELPLAKGPADSGYYEYNNQSFYPVDTITDRRGYSPLVAADNKLHNFLFCMQGHAAFEYTPGLKFEFRGDDDVWVFINKKLAVDLGGTHGPESTYVNLDKLKLREGSVYPFDIFYCERQTNGSSIQIRTTMDLQPSWKYRATPVVTTGKISVNIEGQKSSNYVPSCADLTSGKTLPWTTTDGRMVVVGPDGSDLSDIYTFDTALYGGNLAYKGGNIQLDTNQLKLRPELMWPGTYTIRVESRLGDSLYAINFTKMYGAVNVTGLVLDGNGDGVADSIRLTAGRPIFGDKPEYHLVWFNAAGQRDSVLPTASQVRVISDSIVVAPLTKAWGKRTQIPVGAKVDSAGAILSHPGGLVTALVNPIKLVDGIAPYADSARLVYGVNGASDTLKVWVNENATQNPAAALSDVWAKVGRSSAPRNVSVTKADLVPGEREIKLILPAGHGIGISDSVRVAGLVADVLFNASTNSSVWVPIRSTAMGSAALFDANGDGQADSLSVYVRGSLSGVKSVQIDWKDAAGAPIRKTWPVAGTVSGSFGVPAGALAFPKYATSCPGGGCQVTFLDAASAVLETWPLYDSVAPAVVRGHYSFGEASDTLGVKFSEPVTTITKLPTWLEWGSAGVLVAPVMHSNLGPLAITDSAYFALDTANGIRASYDSIRMASGMRAGQVADLGGTLVGKSSPWAPVTFGIPPMLVVLRDPAGLGRGTDLTVSPRRSVPAAALASIATLNVVWNDALGQVATQALNFATLARSGDTWSGSLPAAFEFGATGCLSGGCQVLAGASTGESRVWQLIDQVPPVMVRARLRYAADGVNGDTVIVRSSEPWEGAIPGSSLSFVSIKAAAGFSLLSMINWTLASDARDAYILIDSVVSSKLDRGDSARFLGGASALVRDRDGNLATDQAPWIPIEFGLRPPFLQITPFPGNGVLK